MFRVRRLPAVVLLCFVLMVPVSTAARTTVRVSSWYTYSPGEFLDVMKTRFEAENPKYEIEFLTVPSSQYYDQLQVLVAAGTSPDVAMLGFDWIGAMANNNVAMNIDKLVRERFPVQELFPTIQRAVQWKGQYFALPRDITAKVFYYNRKHFNEAGVAFPQDDWTWRDFLTAAKSIHRVQGEEVTRWGFAMDFVLDGQYHWYSTNSADWFNADRSRVTMTDEKTIEVMQFLQDLIYTHGVTPTPAQRNAMTNAATAFLTDRAAMQVGGSGVPDSTKYPELDWGAANLPMNTQPGTRVWANSWIIPTGTKDLEAAWATLAFFAGPEGQKVAAEMNTGFPSLRRIAMTMSVTHNYQAYILRAFEVGAPYPAIANRNVWNVFNTEFGKFWRNEAPARPMAENLQRQVEPLMAQ
ncbi:MAG: ABC transporter substrate-binding protein [Limnochordia bacterium]